MLIFWEFGEKSCSEVRIFRISPLQMCEGGYFYLGKEDYNFASTMWGSKIPFTS